MSEGDRPLPPALTAAQLALVPEVIPHLVWVARADGRVEYVNRHGVEFLGMAEAGEGARWSWAEALHPEDRERVRAEWEEAVATGTRYESFYRLQRVDGAYVDVVGRANPIRGLRQSVELWVGTVSEAARDPRLAEAAATLTPRELDVLSLASEGNTTREIAARLGVAPATVKTHFENVFEKLGVRDRTAAVAYALRRGLIE